MVNSFIAKRGSLLYIIATIIAVSALGLAWFLVFFILIPQKQLPLFSLLSFLVEIFVGIYIAIAIFTKSIVIKPNALVDSGPFGKTELLMEHCTEVRIMPGFGETVFFGVNIFASFEREGTRQSKVVLASLYANRHELVKAVIESAYRSNPNVSVDRLLLLKYNRPPYGIFNIKKAP